MEIDNLKDHVLNVGDDKEAGAVKTGADKKKKRKLTMEESNELRSTKMVKHRATIAQKDVTFADFNFIMVLGRGTFGKVFLVELKSNKKLYAVKSIRKDILIEYEQVESTLLEKQIMLEVEHPNLIYMVYVF